MEEALGIAQLLEYLTLAKAQFAHLPIELAKRHIANSVREMDIKVHVACNEHKEKIDYCLSLNADQLSTNFLENTLKARRNFWNQSSN